MLTYIDSWVGTRHDVPDSKVPGAKMGPIWGRQDPGGPHVGPMNLVIYIWGVYQEFLMFWSVWFPHLSMSRFMIYCVLYGFVIKVSRCIRDGTTRCTVSHCFPGSVNQDKLVVTCHNLATQISQIKYLTKKANDPAQCTHGGSTRTFVVLGKNLIHYNSVNKYACE